MDLECPTVFPVSRPSTIGIDVGATKVVAAVVSADGTAQQRIDRKLTPDSNSAGLVDALARAVTVLRTTMPSVTAVGVGTAGVVQWPDGAIEFAANHGHRGLKLGRNLAARCGLPVVVDNDANAAAWAEASTGRYADQGVLFLAIGTGLGSGFVINGELMRGHHGRGAELGHVVVDRTSSERCACGLLGCLEVLASGRALERAGRKIVRTKPTSPLAARADRVKAVDMPMMIEAALAGDHDVAEVLRTMGGHLGRAIAEIAMSLLPVDRVVVGGGLSVLDRLLLDPMRRACEKTLASSRCYDAPRITLSRYGKDATLVGAALLAGREATRQAAADPSEPQREKEGPGPLHAPAGHPHELTPA